MNITRVVTQIKEKYPGKKIIKNNKNNPTEILCEVDPSEEHFEYSLAIAVIDESKPHFHKKTTEEYRILRGELKLFVGEEVVNLREGEKHTVTPNQVHWAEGNETWVECLSKPGWTFEDHILV